MKNFLKTLAGILIAIWIVTLVFKVKINHVEVVNNRAATDIEIVSELFQNEFDKTSIVFFIKERFGKHKNIKYINDYLVEWQTPFSIIIKVYENPAIAYVRRDLKKVYFDKDGIINDITDEVKGNLMEVEGVSFKSYKKGDALSTSDSKIINAILNVSRILYDKNIPVSLMQIDKNDKISLYIGNITVNLGDTQNMEIKLQRLEDIYKEISDLSGTLDLSNARENMLDEQYIFKKN